VQSLIASRAGFYKKLMPKKTKPGAWFFAFLQVIHTFKRAPNGLRFQHFRVFP